MFLNKGTEMKQLLYGLFFMFVLSGITFTQIWYIEVIDEAKFFKSKQVKNVKIYSGENGKTHLSWYKEYDKNGNITDNFSYAADTVESREIYSYDSQGRMVNIETPAGDNSWNFSLEYEGSSIYPSRKIKRSDNTIEYFYYTNGLLTKITSDAGWNITFEYDAKKRLVRRNANYGTWQDNIQTYTYEGNRKIMENSNDKVKWKYYEYVYDDKGVLLETIHQDKDRQKKNTILRTYNEKGLLTLEEHTGGYIYEYFYEFYEENTADADLKLLEQATAYYNSAMYAEAIELLKKVSEESSSYSDALELMIKCLKMYSPSGKPEYVVVYGRIHCECAAKLYGYVVFEDLLSGSRAGRCLLSSYGYYYILLPVNKKYSYFIDAPGFYPVAKNLDLTANVAKYIINDDFQVVSLEQMAEQNLSVRINNIFFDYDKSALRNESFLELDRVVTLLNDNPAISIEISGYTDNKGSDDYNIKLSQSRAKSVRDYLVSKGINPDRVISKGYGKTNPVAGNDTEEGRQLNRRVEFKILKK